MAYHTGPKIVTDGLVLCLDAADRNSYTDSDTTWTDLSGYGNSGIFVNMDSANYDGGNNGSFVFNDGVTNEYVNTNFFYDGANAELTMGVWMKAPAAAQRCGLFGFRSSTSQNQLYITGDVNAGTFGTGCSFDDWRSAGGGIFTSWRSVYALSTPVCDGNWHFIMVSRSIGATRLYVDGVLIDENSDGTITQITSDNNYKFGIAGNSTGVLSSYYFQGNIAVSYIYNRGLSSDEVLQNYNAVKGRYGLTDGVGFTPPPVSTTPGVVQSFTYAGSTETSCNSSNTITYTWTAPADDGGSSITGYSLRRIGNGRNNTIGGPIIGDPSAYFNSFRINCAESLIANNQNPITIANINGTVIEDWSCGYYSFQIAAINANGTGVYYPSGESDLLTVNRGYTSVGNDVISVDVEVATIDVTYISSSGGCGPSQINYQNTSGNLYDWETDSLESTYSQFSQGTAQFTKPATAGWYYVRIWETWTDYTNNCQRERAGCITFPFYVE
jgi:hypothetical protein